MNTVTRYNKKLSLVCNGGAIVGIALIFWSSPSVFAAVVDGCAIAINLAWMSYVLTRPIR